MALCYFLCTFFPNDGHAFSDWMLILFSYSNRGKVLRTGIICIPLELNSDFL